LSESTSLHFLSHFPYTTNKPKRNDKIEATEESKVLTGQSTQIHLAVWFNEKPAFKEAKIELIVSLSLVETFGRK
jgi:hypothetical protein